MRTKWLFIVPIGLGTAAQAQIADVPQSDQTKHAPLSRHVPTLSSPMDELNLTTTDTGRDVERRLELAIPDSKDTFIFGDKTTSYPLSRKPGDDFTRPLVPPQDHYSIGIGKRF